MGSLGADRSKFMSYAKSRTQPMSYGLDLPIDLTPTISSVQGISLLPILSSHYCLQQLFSLHTLVRIYLQWEILGCNNVLMVSADIRFLHMILYPPIPWLLSVQVCILQQRSLYLQTVQENLHQSTLFSCQTLPCSLIKTLMLSKQLPLRSWNRIAT